MNDSRHGITVHCSYVNVPQRGMKWTVTAAAEIGNKVNCELYCLQNNLHPRIQTLWEKNGKNESEYSAKNSSHHGTGL